MAAGANRRFRVQNHGARLIDNPPSRREVDSAAQDYFRRSQAGALATMDAISVGNITAFAEEVQDIVGAMVAGNTETGIAVTYDDTGGKLDFAVPATTAAGVSLLDAGGNYTATDVEAALAEVMDALQAHEADTTDAHDASAISIVDGGGYYSGTDVEAALQYVGARVADLDAAVVLRGTWDASAGTFPGGGTAQAGSSYIVSVAGTVNSVAFAVGDRIIAVTDNASTTTFATNWFKADYTDAVSSVDGFVGAVSLSATYQPLDADLTSWAGVTRASGFDAFAATPSSANLRALLTDEVGSGVAYFVGGALGTPGSATLTNATGLPTILAANEATDTSCFLAFFTNSTGELGPKTNANMTFNSNTGVVTFASSVLTTADINGGTADAVVIGGSTPAAVTGTTVTATGSVFQNTTVRVANFDAMAYLGLQVNGSQELSQEVGTTSTAIVSATDKYITDQWALGFTSGVAVVAGQQRSATPSPPAGYVAYLRMQATTADASLAAGEYFYFRQPIEGLRSARLGYGAAGAQSMSIGLWVYASITGTFTVAIRNSAANRSYVSNITISAATTWEWKTVTIPGDTSGTWLTDTEIGMNLILCFGSGSTFHGTNNTWNAANRFATASTTNFFATNNNVVAITGVVVLPGDAMPASTHAPLLARHISDELVLCGRYWQPSGTLAGAAASATAAAVLAEVEPRMRVAPTVALVAGTNALSEIGVGDHTITAWTTYNTTTGHVFGEVTSSGMTGGKVVVIPGSGTLSYNARM